jgi:uncharacterized lipoprotein YmbA
MLLCVLAACGAPPAYFILPPPEAAPQASAARTTISVAEISLPTYAENIEIATLAGPGTVAVDTKNLWADTPRRALTRHLVASLQARLGAQIATEPWPGLDRPALRVEVIADRMIGPVTGPLRFSGQYLIVSDFTGQIAVSKRFSFDIPVQGEGYPAFMAAHARAIEALADEIARAIARV